jgi:hypothetical protein
MNIMSSTAIETDAATDYSTIRSPDSQNAAPSHPALKPSEATLQSGSHLNVIPIVATPQGATTPTASVSHPWDVEGLTHRLNRSRVSKDELKQLRKKELVEFYENQNDMIDDFLSPLLEPQDQEDHNNRVCVLFYAFHESL